jgi:hypothetical protein
VRSPVIVAGRMTDHAPLTPERLSELLARLDEVMSDAARLRRQINRQLSDQRRDNQQKVTVTRNKRRQKQR